MCYGAQWIVHLQGRGGANDHVIQSHQLTCGGYKSSVQSIHADTPGRMTLALPLKPAIMLYRLLENTSNDDNTTGEFCAIFDENF